MGKEQEIRLQLDVDKKKIGNKKYWHLEEYEKFRLKNKTKNLPSFIGQTQS